MMKKTPNAIAGLAHLMLALLMSLLVGPICVAGGVIPFEQSESEETSLELEEILLRREAFSRDRHQRRIVLGCVHRHSRDTHRSVRKILWCGILSEHAFWNGIGRPLTT